MTPAPRHHDLADTLICHATGLTSNAAAAELIAAHHTWLTRTDFVTTCIHAGIRHDRHPYAYIDWEHAITALDSHQLPCSPSEAGILRIAASLGDHHIPVTTTTRPPQRQPGHHQAPSAPSAGPFPSLVMPTQRDADMPTLRVAEQLARTRTTPTPAPPPPRTAPTATTRCAGTPPPPSTTWGSAPTARA